VAHFAMSFRNNTERQKAGRQQLRLLAFALFVLSLYVIVTSVLLLREQPPLGLEVWFPQRAREEADAQPEPGMHASRPVRLAIPALDIDTTFEGSLGLDDAGAIEVPDSYEEVGWYRFGPTPGETGPAVIIGHVDSIDGAAIFFYLGQLSVGDEVVVTREDGSKAVFAVQALERYPQDEFPTDRVYGSIPYAGVRLITCSGTYDRDADSYSHNLVVYGRLMHQESTATSATPSE
jgi:sortase (surface protein transpeptidase)